MDLETILSQVVQEMSIFQEKMEMIIYPAVLALTPYMVEMATIG